MESTPHPEVKKHPPNRKKSILYTLTAWLFFTSVIALSRYVSDTHSVPVILFFQYFVCLMISLPWFLREKRKTLKLSKFGVIVVRSVAGFMTYAFVFLAVKKTDLVNVVLLSNTAPLFIPLIIWLWRRVKISPRLWVGIIAGFIGIGFILQPSKAIANIGALLGLCAGIATAISMIAQRRLVKSDTVPKLLFYYFLIGTIMSIPFALESWTPIDHKTLWILLAIGVLFAIAQIFYTKAFKYEKPSFVGPFNYSAVIYGLIIDWWIWKIIPSWTAVVGISIVVAGSIFTLTQSRGISKGEGPG